MNFIIVIMKVSKRDYVQYELTIYPPMIIFTKTRSIIQKTHTFGCFKVRGPHRNDFIRKKTQRGKV